MRLLFFLLTSFTVFVPETSEAIELRWASGSTTLEFTTAIRCTLSIEAEVAEGVLPETWRLIWVAENCELRPIADPAGACEPGRAGVVNLLQAATAAEITGQEVTAEFCSPETGGTALAFQVFDLPAGSRGQLKVVALDPTDESPDSVLESNIVTFNGGIAAAFSPVILHTRTEHNSTEFKLTAVGSGLGELGPVALRALDGTWRAMLAVGPVDEHRFTATGAFAASVPACVVEAQGESGAATASVEADPPPPPLDPQAGCQQQFIEDIYPPYTIQAKDFAFVPGGWTPSGSWKFHLFYIRQNQFMAFSSTSKNLGHAVSHDLDQWTVLDTAAVKVRPGRFDSDHVWAPTIVRRGLTYHMFYTGVDAGQNQRIGIATSTDLVNWVQGDSVLTAEEISWADESPPPPLYAGQSQLRDPFVMEDPNQPGQWLMYFVTVPDLYSPGMVVGVAKSSGNFSTWQNAVPLWATLRPYVPGVSSRVESPHAFLRDGKWWLFHTVNTAADDTVHAISNATGPADTVTGNWSAPKGLQFLVPLAEAGAYNRWHATEYLEMSEDFDLRYLAAFNDLTTGISYTQMRPTAPPFLFTGDCPTAVAVGDGSAAVPAAQLLVLGSGSARSDVRFRIDLPERSTVSLVIYDVRGRRVQTVVEGELPSGTSHVVWDGRDLSGAMMPGGVYFGGMQTPEGRVTVRVPIVR